VVAANWGISANYDVMSIFDGIRKIFINNLVISVVLMKD